MEASLLQARIRDALCLSQKNGCFKSVGFLSAGETALCQATAGQNGGWTFYGGYEQAERVLFVALPDWCEDPATLGLITPLTILYKKEYALSHRDFLGTVLSLGLTRETVGDILVEPGRAVVFVLSENASYITQQMTKVGGVGVQVSVGVLEPLPGFSCLCEKTATVASMRLDCVVSALMGTSRQKAQQTIAQGLVCLDGLCCEKVTAEVRNGQKISIRGCGRFTVTDCAGVSKKGRIILQYGFYM